MATLYNALEKDLRYREGLTACINCGTCTAICPAASVWDYDPRLVVDTVQQHNEAELEQLLKSDTIWYCGECLSCKTRCPRGNTPGYIIQALRALSIETGYFTESVQGQKQLAIKRTVGDHILKYGYCVYIDEVDTDMYPEQGPVWDWLKENRQSILQRLGTSYQKKASGTLRQIPQESLNDLQRIFEETGATERFKKIEDLSAKKAGELGIQFSHGKDDYFQYLYNQQE
ncbi:4Fe-4S dicluster domain-containing protein [Williamwhitmania taraxaci]|uniref:Heterodisulfide reductase subunit C n=1 Tax=Williamwhitmania taraxaci TaxID=1640674 RepID=A0A1G6HF45_9BACT|nr:4Fe-4S dicluster domain-containing protein [Williamwhitmania taraxaci]SDB92947.1 heterodisulfide reductase subunit C [Williamwhitmania taraxaci]